MAFKTVDPELILKEYPIPEQHGPLRQYDKEKRCAMRGCGSSTFYKVNGISRCTTHALRELNQMLYERGIDAGSSNS